MTFVATKHIIETKIQPAGAVCFRDYRDELPVSNLSKVKQLMDYHREPAIGDPTDWRRHIGRRLREWLIAGNEISNIEKMTAHMGGPTLNWWWVEGGIDEKDLLTYDVNVYVEGKTVVLRGKNFIAERGVHCSYMDEFVCSVMGIYAFGPVHDRTMNITVPIYTHGSSYLSVSLHYGLLSYDICDGKKANNVYFVDSEKVRIFGMNAGKYAPTVYNVDDPGLPGEGCGFSLTMSNCLDAIRAGRLICQSARGLLTEWEKNIDYA